MSNTIAFLDFETTGFDPAYGDRPTEIALVFVRDQRIIDRYESLMNPGRHIPSEITALTGIDDSMVRNEPSVSDVFLEIQPRLRGLPIVAHYATFERKFLESEYQRIGKRFSNRLICTCKIGRRIYADSVDHKLGTLANHVGLSFNGNSHRAMPDADLTARLWIEMERKLEREFGLKSVSVELMARLQTKPVGDFGNYLKRIAERQKREAKATPKKMPAARRELKKAAQAKPTRPKPRPRPSPRPLQLPEKIREDLMPEYALRVKNGLVSPVPDKSRRSNSLSEALMPENVLREQQGNVPPPSEPARATRAHESSTAPTLQCLHCDRIVTIDSPPHIPWQKCPSCEELTVKPIEIYDWERR